LTGELTDYGSLRAVGQRYRIIYRIEKENVEIFVVKIGIRKEDSKVNIYDLAKKMIRLHLVG